MLLQANYRKISLYTHCVLIIAIACIARPITVQASNATLAACIALTPLAAPACYAAEQENIKREAEAKAAADAKAGAGAQQGAPAPAQAPESAKEIASACKDGLCRPANYNQEWAGSMLRGTVPGLINGVLTRVLPLVGVIFLVMFVWGGIQWLTSAGDAKKVSGARTTLFNAIVGVTIVSLAYFIVSQFLRLISI